MTKNFKKTTLVSLSKLKDNDILWNGTIFRQYEVGRLDANSEQEDYYDLMMFQLESYAPNSFFFIDVTDNGPNNGKIAYEISNIRTQYFIMGKDIKNYFDSSLKLFIISKVLNT